MKLPSFSLVICSALKSTMHEHVLSPFSVQFFAIPGTVALQAPLSMGFSMHETGVGCHALLQRILLTQGSNLCLPCLLHWQTDSLPLSQQGSPPKPRFMYLSSFSPTWTFLPRSFPLFSFLCFLFFFLPFFLCLMASYFHNADKAHTGINLGEP